MLDKAKILIEYIKRVRDILNNNADFLRSIEGEDFTANVKIVSDEGEHIERFMFGVNNGKLSISSIRDPDLIVVICESAFFGLIRGTMTLEQAYGLNMADLVARDGNEALYRPGIKEVFDRIQDAGSEKLKELEDVDG